jgi:hypothetical protein
MSACMLRAPYHVAICADKQMALFYALRTIWILVLGAVPNLVRVLVPSYVM